MSISRKNRKTISKCRVKPHNSLLFSYERCFKMPFHTILTFFVVLGMLCFIFVAFPVCSNVHVLTMGLTLHPCLFRLHTFSLRKHAYSNILRILQTKNEHFQMKNSRCFHISAQNIDCGYLLEPPRRGGSNEFSQSMFLSSNKKINVYPCKPWFYCMKVGFKGVKTI